MIEIVTFYRQDNEIEIGFRQGVAVVYASVSSNLTDDEAKQKAYEQAKSALEYEQTRDKPSFTIGNEVDEDDNVIEFEKFIPAEPTVKEITIHGERLISFADDSSSKTLEFVASAVDQYGKPIVPLYEWTGADNGVLTVNNVDGTYEVTASADGVTESITVTVQAYQEPVYVKPIEDEVKELKQENVLIKGQNNALSERADFIEDVVAEMAIQVYK